MSSVLKMSLFRGYRGSRLDLFSKDMGENGILVFYQTLEECVGKNKKVQTLLLRM